DGRQYFVTHPTRAVGFVRSVPFQQDSWVSDLFVVQSYRGQGYGRALMARLLRDDKKAGLRNSILLASRAGARLYPHVGYQLMGELQIFCPVKGA
ncbi:MAG: GNAT family N-acetyltransferase, partial [bacterium]